MTTVDVVCYKYTPLRNGELPLKIRVMILLGIGLFIAFTVSGIQIFLDRKNL